MFLLSLTRIIRFALQNFYRNIWLSLVTITIIVLTLLSLTSLIILNAGVNQTIITVKNKIDVSLYFTPNIDTETVSLIKEQIGKYATVAEVNLINATQALEKFKNAHANDSTIKEALNQLETNPLGPTLTIKAKNANLYPQILEQIKKDKLDTLAEEIDYDDNKLVIEKLSVIGQKIKKVGFIISIVFTIISLLVVFNTIRIGIYTHREEINIMKLVGAENWFVRLPFLFEGALYAFIGCLFFWLIFYLAVSLIQPFLSSFLIDINFNIMSYIWDHFIYIFGFELILMIVLNTISGFVAISKYLRT
ncbi:MAG TPA: permease-like cell division protein FtsX [bacterium]|nr:permease-like cell division protein FtsX [bacterium]HPL95371.1 permease-like cell division protein FtsX [bacterium]